MARPRIIGLEYFPHDTNAHMSEKIERLVSQYGNDGYAAYFILLERIYMCEGYELDVSSDDKIKYLAGKTNLSVKKFEKIVATAIELNCFSKDDFYERKVLTSNGIKKRTTFIDSKRETERERYNKKENKLEGISVEVSAAENKAELEQSKEKQRKV
ncbi:DUF4373 domain-containing protein [Clostridium sp. C8-1-8]|uniref:DUF4373 domain-containing protein n=1 Tax=Clostridium sp. C8-1-8 TaxID=2698831 RepID=UPI001368837C|nr:DUF4373 domain-containing protein [Clostridium sp. C8-1-8]